MSIHEREDDNNKHDKYGDDDDNFRMREEFYPYQILFSCVIVSFNVQSSSSSSLSCRRHVGSWKI